VVADYPQFAPATRRLALLYAGRPTAEPRAVELATRARQAYPDDPDIAKTLGILNYRRGLYPPAAELLKQAAAQRRNHPELHYHLGAAHHQLKEWSECKAALQRALAADLAPALAEAARRALTECSETSPL
jgi:uncharacterized protein HemY